MPTYLKTSINCSFTTTSRLPDPSPLPTLPTHTHLHTFCPQCHSSPTPSPSPRCSFTTTSRPGEGLNYIVASTDAPSLAACMAHRLPCFNASSILGTHDASASTRQVCMCVGGGEGSPTAAE